MTRRDSSSSPARLLQAWRANPVAVKALSFGLIGVINSAVDFGVFSLGYYYFGLSILASQLIAWVIAVTGSYVMNSLITFSAEFRKRIQTEPAADSSGAPTARARTLEPAPSRSPRTSTPAHRSTSATLASRRTRRWPTSRCCSTRRAAS